MSHILNLQTAIHLINGRGEKLLSIRFKNTLFFNFISHGNHASIKHK